MSTHTRPKAAFAATTAVELEDSTAVETPGETGAPKHRFGRGLAATLLGVIGLLLASIPNAAADLNDGLVGYWSFDEGEGGTAHDYSGNGNDGTILGASWVAGVHGSALSFDGNDEVVIPDSSSLDITGDITLYAWLFIYSMPCAGPVFSKGTSSDNYGYYSAVGSCYGYKANFQLRSAAGGRLELNSDQALQAGQWYQVVAVRSGTAAHIYIDGQPSGTLPCFDGAIRTNALPLSLGTHYESSIFYHGIMDELRLYNRALSDVEIEQLHQEVMNVDLAVGIDDILLTGLDPDVQATVTVHNLGEYEASNVGVEIFKRTDGDFVSVGTNEIPSIEAGSEASTDIIFTPDFEGQELKIVASLPDLLDDADPSNNQVIVEWRAGPEPAVLSVKAQHDGNDLPDVAGRYISSVEVDNAFYASVQPAEAAVAYVRFQMDSGTPVDGVQQADGRWKATFDMGDLSGSRPHTLTVIATDALDNSSEPEELSLQVIPLPSWAETWNSGFSWNHRRYDLGGFVPIEWRLDHRMPDDWLVIGGLPNRFRAGLYTEAEVALDRQIHGSDMMPGLYVAVLGFPTIDFKANNVKIPSGIIKLMDFLDPGNPYTAPITLYNAFDVVFSFEPDTVEITGLALTFEDSLTHDLIEIPLTPTPVYFTLGGWPMSFEADLTFTPGVDLCMTAGATGSGIEWTQPTYVRPNLNIQVAGTINIIDVVIAAIGASIQPNLNVGYDIAWVPPNWDPDWLIEFVLDICARLRLGFCPFCKKFDLGCLTLLDYTLFEGFREGDFGPLLDPPVDPEGVLMRPVIISAPGRGERLLVYSQDTVDGPEIAAQIDPGTGTWGPQTFVTNDQLHADLDLTLAYTHDGHAVAVWTKVEALAEDIETSTIDELMGTFDLYWSIWDGVSWSAEAPLTDDAFADGMAKVAFSDTTANGLALWARDEANDFDDVTADEIAYATWDGASWSALAMLTNDALGDRQVAVCYRTGTSEAVAVWTKETDPVDHLSTLYYAQWDGATWTTPAAIPGVAAEWASQVNAAPLSDGRVIASWAVQAEDGWQVKLALFDPVGGWGSIETVQSQLTLVDGLQLRVSDGDVAHLFWHGYTIDDDLFGISKDFASRSEGWVGPTNLTDALEIEWQPTGAVGSDGELSLVYAREQSRSGDRMPANRNGLPEGLGSSAVPGNGNWAVTDEDLTLLGNPWLGEEVTVEAIVTNTGTSDSVPTTAQFWLGDPDIPESTPIGDPISLDAVPPAGTAIIESEVFSLDQVGQVDVYLVVAAPMAEGDPADNQAVLNIDVINNDTTPPQVLGTQVLLLRDHGRMGAKLIVTFDEAMTPPTVQDVVLVGATSGQAVPDYVLMDLDNEVMSVVFEDYLSRDTYTFTVVASRVTDAAGNNLDGNGDGTGGDDYVFIFSDDFVPMADAAGCRYLELTPKDGPDPVALLVTGDPDDPDVSCVSLYVQADGSLDVDPVFQTPTTWGTLHVTDEEIIAGASYSVQADFGTPGDPMLSVPAGAPTWAWGDLNQDYFVNGRDLFLFIEAYLGNLPFPTGDLCSAEPSPGIPDGIVDGDDLLCWIDAFYGEPYPFSVCGRGGSREAGRAAPAALKAARLTIVPRAQHVKPGQPVSVDVFLVGAQDLRLYQVAMDVKGGASGALLLHDVSIDATRNDYVFAGESPVSIPDTRKRRVVSALWEGGVSPSGHRYLATFTFVTSRDAKGEFRLMLRGDLGTMLRDSERRPIPIAGSAAATIRVGGPELPKPTIERIAPREKP